MRERELAMVTAENRLGEQAGIDTFTGHAIQE